MIHIYEIHCPSCKMNVTIETDVKAKRKHRCNKCGRILQDGHLPEDENKKVVEELEKEVSRVKEPENKKTNKSKTNTKTTRKKRSLQSATRSVRKKK